MQNEGIGLSALDMQIAAHAVHVKAILVSSDRAFGQLTEITHENWLA
jgi:predicted nucleic acid-binding protein